MADIAVLHAVGTTWHMRWKIAGCQCKAVQMPLLKQGWLPSWASADAAAKAAVAKLDVCPLPSPAAKLLAGLCLGKGVRCRAAHLTPLVRIDAGA